MRLFATLNDKRQGEIDGTIYYSGLKEPVHIKLLIDSGAARTCILQDDVIRLGIDYNPLAKCDFCFITANGIVKPKKMTDVLISIPVVPDGNKKDFLLPLNFPELPIILPVNYHKEIKNY